MNPPLRRLLETLVLVAGTWMVTAVIWSLATEGVVRMMPRNSVTAAICFTAIFGGALLRFAYDTSVASNKNG